MSAVQRAFRDWLAERSPHLPVEIVVGNLTDTAQEFAFAGWPELECSVTDRGLDVAAMKDGECWDVLLSLDVVPVQRGSEWVCSICEAEGRTKWFATPEALWRDHLFEPLEEWVVERLAPAEQVRFHRIGCGSTWARLA